jgi:hypothetical protein
MADLKSLLTDPNYINANGVTKQAIFDKFSAQDPNFVNANEDTQIAIRKKYGVFSPALPALTPEPAAPAPALAAEGMPAPRQQLTPGQQNFNTVKKYTYPALEAVSAALGGAAGAPLGPPGIALGAGLGYGIAKEFTSAADRQMDLAPPRRDAAIAIEPIKNVLEGATMEAGGQVVAPLLGKAAGKVMDVFRSPELQAATIARASLQSDVPAVLNALRTAPANQTAAQATAGITNPTWQALIERRLAADPKFTLTLKNMNEQDAVNELAKIANGVTETEIRAAAEATKRNITAVTTPMRDTALNRANLGKDVADLESRASSMSQQAAAEVQRVRELVKAGNIAEAAARLELIKKNLPVGFTKYTYKGDLARMADEWATQAADASLDLGQGARMAQGAADSLRSAGIKPLNAPALVTKIKSVATNPEFAGNDVMSTAIKNVADDIAKWTTSGGLIDAVALDAIRKNSVNAAIRQLNPGADATTQRNLAAGVLSKLKPIIDDAIEGAGGVGYKDYLAAYSKGMASIAEQKLAGKALELFRTNKKGFVDLVEGNSPEQVEKILGPGSYNIAKDVSEKTLTVLRDQAAKVTREMNITGQAAEGKEALVALLSQQQSGFRIPSFFNPKVTAANAALDILERKIGAKSMRILTEAFKTPQGTVDLLKTLPAAESNRVLKFISDPSSWYPGTGTATGATVKNALAPENQNALNNR